MPTLKLERNKVKVLEIDIEGKIYKVPLGTMLKRDELLKLQGDEASNAFFEKYIGKALWNDLNVGEQRQIANAWSEATRKDSDGMEPGE